MDMSVKLNLSYPAAKSATLVVEKTLEQPRVSTASVAEFEEQSKGQETNQGKLNTAVREIEKFVQSVKRNLEFSIDEASGKVIVKVIASDSGEVVRQIPNEEILKLANSLNDASSLLFSAEA